MDNCKATGTGRPTESTYLFENAGSEAPAHHELTRLAQGYRVTQVLYVAAELGLADLLGDGPKSSIELAHLTETHAPSLYRLLRALSALGILEETDKDRFALTPRGEYLRADAPEMLRFVVLMNGCDNVWRTWGELLRSIRTGQSGFSHIFKTANPFGYYARHPEVDAIVTASWIAHTARIAAAVAKAYDFSNIGTLVDVGGSRGQLLAPILRAYPSVRGVLFDLPHVVQAPLTFLEEARVRGRCEIVAGDMFASVPAGGDAYILSHVIHDWDDQCAISILTTCRAAMQSSTKLLLIERVLPERVTMTDRNQRLFLGDLNMLVRTGGRERTRDEHQALLDAAGLRMTRLFPTSTEVTIVESVRP